MSNDKKSRFKRTGQFLKDVRAELRKVTWPSKREVYSTTIVVIIATFFFGFFLYAVDILFSWVVANVKSFFG
ncbi:MAG: preprotein translocase subunit SecE [Candidatus Aminicenantia bacterium]